MRGSLGVRVLGDLPFVARDDSPEVWSRADEFQHDVSAGVPPDAFSAEGQDWGLPTYDWEVIARSGYAWIRRRAERAAVLFDGVRVDHVIGLFRTYGRPAGSFRVLHAVRRSARSAPRARRSSAFSRRAAWT